jgi:hypothetical protein
MKHALAAACAAFSFSFAGAAFADSQIDATLQSPQSSPLKLIAASAVWNCQGDTCSAGMAPDDAVGVSGCKELAKQVGRLTAYTFDHRSLDEKSLAKCNTAAKASVAMDSAAVSGR